MKIAGILEKMVQVHRFKKYILFCLVYINWLKLAKGHGKKCRRNNNF